MAAINAAKRSLVDAAAAQDWMQVPRRAILFGICHLFFCFACRNEVGRHGAPLQVRALAEAGRSVNFSGRHDGCVPLHFAAKFGHTDEVIHLFLHGAEVDVRDKNGFTPLHYASGMGHLAVVRHLLCHGADPLLRVKRPDGEKLASDLALANKHTEVVFWSIVQDIA